MSAEKNVAAVSCHVILIDSLSNCLSRLPQVHQNSWKREANCGYIHDNSTPESLS